MWKCEECGSNEKATSKDICHTCYMKVWRKENQDKHRDYVNKYREKNKYKKGVWDKAGRHIKIEGLCERCGKVPAEHRHHPDYSKPLYVKLVCNKCHREIHKEGTSDKIKFHCTCECGKCICKNRPDSCAKCGRTKAQHPSHPLDTKSCATFIGSDKGKSK